MEKQTTELKQEKTVAESRSQQVQIIMPQHINGQKRLFGGRLMEWIDIVAAVVARRHSGHQVTTVCVDNLVFSAAAHVNSTVILDGKITHLGRTSMEVRVDTFTEELSGKRENINVAYLVLVAIDENEKPVVVPRLKLVSEEERLEWQHGEMRELNRKKRKADGI